MLSPEPAKKKKRNSQGAVVSHSSILIISAFLIGIGAGRASNPALGMSLFMLGIFGFVSYFGLGHLANQRKEKARLRKRQRAAKKLELRMGRHIPRKRSKPGSETRLDQQEDQADRRVTPATASQQLSPC
jgi:hypothetical protein